MKIYFFYNKAFIDVKNYFVNSMKDDFELCPINLDEKFKIGRWSLGGKDDEKVALWLFKTETLIKCIEDNLSENNIIIFSDTDIQFFAPVIPTIEKSMRDKDMCFQREFTHSDINVNIGVIAIRCNQNSLQFWKNTLNMIVHTGSWDQIIVNSVLFAYRQKQNHNTEVMTDIYANMFSKRRKPHKSVINYFDKTGRVVSFDSFEQDIEQIKISDLLWGVFPPKICASSHDIIPPDIEMHHVNLEGGNAEVKLIAMKDIAKMVCER